MNIKSMPKDVAAELLKYIADREDFCSVEEIGSDVSSQTVKSLLREMAGELAKEVALENKADYDVKGCKKLSKLSKTIISCLSPREEKSLLTAFGLIDPSTHSACLGHGHLAQGRK